ncbi:MAG: transcriptional regulator NrdR [Deltaproteobacteria bacterium]|nr:MAG: transcriptional regulator NrdR [Deltaproteobacteria bacterium]
MRCPYCGENHDRVIDSRTAKEGDVIRRRRECESCERRFTTYERVEEIMPLLVKKDNSREPYDRQKVIAGLQKACEKRPISAQTIEEITDRIEAEIQELGSKEVPASVIGEQVMNALRELDAVAYVRFASVYRDFRDLDEFMSTLRDLLNR